MTVTLVGNGRMDSGGVYAAALRGEPCQLHGLLSEPVDLPVHLWSGPVSDSDRALLALCRGRTLDIGCGPGRMAAHLAERGHEVGGIDVVPEAVRQTRERGVSAWLTDVFDAVPRAGEWETVLLADGNIGIGGDPVRLLRRVRELLAPDGRVVADVAAYGEGLRIVDLHLRAGTGTSSPFPWGVVGADQAGAVSAAAGLRLTATYEHADRWFVVLEVV